METIQRMRSSKKKGKRGLSPGGISPPRSQSMTFSEKVQQAVPFLISASQNMILRESSLAENNNKTKPKNELKFESPRLELADSQVFPAGSTAEVLTDPEERWRAVKQQAGNHQQDGSVLRLRPNIDTPKVLQCGMPPKAAARVRELHVQVIGEALPSWMDAIASTFQNLQHLYIAQDPEIEKNKVMRQSITKTRVDAPSPFRKSSYRSSPLRRLKKQQQKEQQEEEREEEEKATEHSNRLKRLYILYRLPDLVSIDGVPVSAAERRLARPDDPNGERVRRDEWVHDENADILISTNMGRGKECVELDALLPVVNVEHVDSGGFGMSPPLTHREKSVEVDLTGNLVEVDVTSDPRSPRGSLEGNTSLRKMEVQEKKQEQPSSMGDVMQCGEMVLHETTSVITDDCHWTAACGLPLFRETKSENVALEVERAKYNFRRSSSWKDCKTSPAAPTKSSSRQKSLTSPWKPQGAAGIPSTSTDEVITVPTKPPCPPGIHPRSAEESETVTPRETTLVRGTIRTPFHRRGQTSPRESPRNRSPSPTHSTAYTKFSAVSTKPRILGSMSLTSPFPMQFREKVEETVDVSDSTTLKVKTAQVSSEEPPVDSTTTPPPVVPPPELNSSRSAMSHTISVATTGVSNMATIESAFGEGTRTPSPQGKAHHFPTDMEKKIGLPPPAPPGMNMTKSSPRFRMKGRAYRRKKKRSGVLDKWKESLLSDEEDNSDCDAFSCTGSDGEIEIEFPKKAIIRAKNTM